MTDAIGFGDRLRVARLQKGYTQQSLADLVGVSRQTIFKLENGQPGMTISTGTKLKAVLPEAFETPETVSKPLPSSVQIRLSPHCLSTTVSTAFLEYTVPFAFLSTQRYS